MSYTVKTIGEKVTLGVLIEDDGNPLVGLSPTMELRRDSDDFYFDFSASSPPYWRASGGQRLLVLPECSWLPGFYRWIFDHGRCGEGRPDDYTATYRLDTPFRVVQIEQTAFGNEFLVLIRKMMGNKQTFSFRSATNAHHTVFDDDGITPVHEADVVLSPDGQVETRTPL